MEGIQVIKYCPWISKGINLKEYFQEYKQLLKYANSGREHFKQVEPDVALKEFFCESDPLAIAKCSTTATGSRTSSRGLVDARSGNLDNEIYNFVDVQKFEIGDSADNTARPSSESDITGLKEEDISPDLLTVAGELPQRDTSKIAALGRAGRCRNWFTGSFMDGMIPPEAPEHLQTLVAQTKELYKRETKRDYIRNRHRHLKYSTTVRLVNNEASAPNDGPLDTNLSGKCLDDIICNVRIQRPYHKKTSQRKTMNDYPKYSEEFLVLGSQNLSELKDSIMCVNEYYCHQEMSQNPDLNVIKYSASIEDNFPSAFFYISGVFYIDKRNPSAMDTSERVRSWGKSVPNYEPMFVKDMTSCKFIDLKIHLGYPYLYQHLGNCEHLITFTDVRLHHRSDVQDPLKYPILRGNPVKMSYKCFACNLYLASWVVKDSPILPISVAHFCHNCLKMMFYDDDDKKIGDFKLYPFMDEFAAKKRKMEGLEKSREKSFNRIVIEGWNPDGSSEFTFMK